MPIVLTENNFRQDITKHEKDLLSLAKKYQPQEGQSDPFAIPVLKKIRRQTPPWINRINNEQFKTFYSFFIHYQKDHSEACRFYFVDHEKHAEGHEGRVLYVFAILDLDLKNNTTKLHIDANGTALARIKSPKKGVSSLVFNDFYLHEYRAMPKYSPALPSLNELDYDFFEVLHSKKNLFFMPDLGTSLTNFFYSKSLSRYLPEYRIKMGGGEQSAAEQLCRAVARLHEDGIVHRDIKPDNILIKDLGDRFITRLGDFGFHTHKYKVDGRHGTPFYLSSEANSSQPKRHPPSVDSYALCLTLAQWIFMDFDSCLEFNFKHHLYKHMGRIKLLRNGYKIIPDEELLENTLLKPLAELLVRGFSADPAKRPTAIQLADCIHQITSKIELPQHQYNIDMNTFDSDLSEEFKIHFFEFIKKYRPLSDANNNANDWKKIRRQDPHGTYATDQAMFMVQHSFYIQPLEESDAYRLYFVDHNEHIHSSNSCVAKYRRMIDVHLNEKSVLVHKPSTQESALGFIKFAQKNTLELDDVEKTLIKEAEYMPKFNPVNQAHHETNYHLCSAHGKLRFFMPNKGTSLLQLFSLKGWERLKLSERLLLGNQEMSLIEQLCRAVAKVHEDGKVHRDIKPSNILIKEMHGGYHLSLGDFGFCCDQNDMLKTSSTIIYTPNEILKEDQYKKKHHPSMDIYALCVTITQLTCCKNFYTYPEDTLHHFRDVIEDLDLFIKQLEITVVGALNPNASKRFSSFFNLVKRGLSVNPDDRPTALELAECAQEVLRQGSPMALSRS